MDVHRHNYFLAAMFRIFFVSLCLSANCLILKSALVTGDGGQADNCTNGFISLERMRRVIDNQLVTARWNRTGIFPGINFTCNGIIQSLTIGANYRGGSGRSIFPEIQLWRPVVGQAGRYTLVNSISYNLTHRINEELRYRIEGDPLLEFQQGDIIGYYQPAEEDSLSRIQLAARMPQPVQNIYYRNGNPNSEFEIDVNDDEDPRNLLVSATSENNSECIGGGFLSEETLRTLIGLEGVGRLINRNARQQITPDINFTCHGTITKWIVGALINNNNMISGPTLQLWRNTGGDNYTKLNETNVTSVAYNYSLIYEFTDFTPIPFQPGDVLGISVPRIGDTILRLRFESDYGPINYYANDLESVLSEITLSKLLNQTYHPLVSLEISVSSTSVGVLSTAGRSFITTTTTPQPTSTGLSSTIILSTSSNLVTPAPGTMLQPEYTPTMSLTTRLTSDLIEGYSTMIQTVTSVLKTMPQTLDISAVTTLSEHNSSPQFMETSIAETSAEHTSSPTSSTSYLLNSSPEASALQSQETSISPSSTPSQTPIPPDIPNPHTTQPIAQSSPPPGTSPPESQESGSVPVAAIGEGAVGAILFVLLVVGVCLVVVCIRRRRMSKVVLDRLPHNTDLRNPVYEGSLGDKINIHNGQLLVQDGTVYESPYTEYDTVNNSNGEPPPPRKETLAEFDNPLYSDTGPVTTSEATFYESTEYAEATCDSEETIYYVPTSGQREAIEESGNIYSTPEIETEKSSESIDYAYVTTKTLGKKIEYFEESNIYWTPASNVSDLYEQLAQHKYREIPRKHIQMGSSLGSGQFGVVNRGKWLGGGGGGPVEVAIKTLRPGTKEEDKLKFLQEAAINGQFRHPNIVRLHGVVTVGEPVMIVLEFLPNGDLRQYLQSLTPQSTPGEQAQLVQLCLSFCQQIASGMSYLASKDFVHRDLAARNILVSANHICKVADFGMARDLEEDSYYISHGGQIPVKWTAPEALHYKKYSTASDVWSFGCLMYEIWSLGHKPFEGYTNAQVMKLVTERYRLAPPPGSSRSIYSLMIQCWNPERSERPSFDYLYKSLKENSALLSERRPQTSVLGAPLETSKDLYIDLQQTYLQK